MCHRSAPPHRQQENEYIPLLRALRVLGWQWLIWGLECTTPPLTLLPCAGRCSTMALVITHLLSNTLMLHHSYSASFRIRSIIFTAFSRALTAGDIAHSLPAYQPCAERQHPTSARCCKAQVSSHLHSAARTDAINKAGINVTALKLHASDTAAVVQQPTEVLPLQMFACPAETRRAGACQPMAIVPLAAGGSLGRELVDEELILQAWVCVYGSTAGANRQCIKKVKNCNAYGTTTCTTGRRSPAVTAPKETLRQATCRRTTAAICRRN